jgi:hypothetical protein
MNEKLFRILFEIKWFLYYINPFYILKIIIKFKKTIKNYPKMPENILFKNNNDLLKKLISIDKFFTCGYDVSKEFSNWIYDYLSKEFSFIYNFD